MSAGTFNVARSVWDHPAFRASEFSEREAFIWLISEAAWKPRRHRAGGRIVDIERGQLCHSVRFMASAWGWTPARVFRFLTKMREENMIEKRNSSETAPTIITLCNYDKYQGERNSDDGKAKQQRNSSETNYKKEIRKEEKDISNEISARAPALLSLFPPSVSPERAQAFIAHRKAMKRPLTAHAVKLLSKPLAECEAGGVSANDAIDLAIARGWQGIETEWVLNKISPNKPKPGGTKNGQSSHTSPRTTAETARLDRLLEVGRRRDAQRGSGGDADPGKRGMASREDHNPTPPLLGIACR